VSFQPPLFSVSNWISQGKPVSPCRDKRATWERSIQWVNQAQLLSSDQRETGRPISHEPIRSTQHATWAPRFPGPARARAKTVGKHRRSRAAAVPRLLPRAPSGPIALDGRTRVAGGLCRPLGCSSRICGQGGLQVQIRASGHPLVVSSAVPTPPRPPLSLVGDGDWALAVGVPIAHARLFSRPNDGQISSDHGDGCPGPDSPAAPWLGWRQPWHQLSAMAAKMSVNGSAE